MVLASAVGRETAGIGLLAYFFKACYQKMQKASHHFATFFVYIKFIM
jgi:hypothetical protein